VAANIGLVVIFNVMPMDSKNLSFTVNFDKGQISQVQTLIAKAKIHVCLKNGYYWTMCSLKN